MPRPNSTASYDERFIAMEVRDQRLFYESQRKRFERRWYDNNFFDDGFHFRFVSRETGKVVDLSQKYFQGVPHRSIPKASRQIRGIANLLVKPEYRPMVRPLPVNPLLPQNEKEVMRKIREQEAKKVGWWLEDEWEEMFLKESLIEMVILACKNYISYIQIWDDDDEVLNSMVYDAFDIYVMGGGNKDIQKSPSLIKSVPALIEDIVRDERFDEQARAGLLPDNKYASSEVKQAYLNAQYAAEGKEGGAATILQDEAYVTEFISDDNEKRIKAAEKKDGVDLLSGKNKGDKIIRQIFGAGNETLYDTYIPNKYYPFAEFRLEPGSLYGTSLIERFIPANKSLDMVLSRIEYWISTQAVGTWLKRKDENFKISNLPGGNLIEYEGTPPSQGQIATLPGILMTYVKKLEDILDEQGAPTSAWGQIPSGIRAASAIESIKESEFASLKIPSDLLKRTIKQIALITVDIADKKFTKARNVDWREEDEIQEFQVIGGMGLDRLREVNQKAFMPAPNIVPIRSNMKIKIEVQSGLGFTTEGKMNRMQQIGEYMRVLAQEGYVTQAQVQDVLKKFLNIFNYGATSEFFDVEAQGDTPFTTKQLEMIKVALAEVINDIDKAKTQGQGQPEQPNQDDNEINKIKVGVAEVLRDIQGAGQTIQ